MRVPPSVRISPCAVPGAFPSSQHGTCGDSFPSACSCAWSRDAPGRSGQARLPGHGDSCVGTGVTSDCPSTPLCLRSVAPGFRAVPGEARGLLGDRFKLCLSSGELLVLAGLAGPWTGMQQHGLLRPSVSCGVTAPGSCPLRDSCAASAAVELQTLPGCSTEGAGIVPQIIAFPTELWGSLGDLQPSLPAPHPPQQRWGQSPSP